MTQVQDNAQSPLDEVQQTPQAESQADQPAPETVETDSFRRELEGEQRSLIKLKQEETEKYGAAAVELLDHCRSAHASYEILTAGNSPLPHEIAGVKADLKGLWQLAWRLGGVDNPPPNLPKEITSLFDALQAIGELVIWVKSGQKDTIGNWVPADASARPNGIPSTPAPEKSAGQGSIVERNGENGSPARATPTKRSQPSEDAIKAYRVQFATGKKQTDLAELLTKEFKRPVSQGQVSKWLNNVKKWLEGGNVLPPLLEAKPASTIDPDRLAIGPRIDGRTQRQRGRRDASED